jgi:hypothetical protein
VFDEEVNGQQGESETEERKRTTLRMTALIVLLLVVHLSGRKEESLSKPSRKRGRKGKSLFVHFHLF